MRIEFTPTALQNLPVPPRLPSGAVAQVRYFDKTFPGFGVRIASTGKRVWIYQRRVRGKTRVATLPWSLDLADARAEAAVIRRQDAAAGVQHAPALDEKPAASAAHVETFLAAANRFLDWTRQNRRTKTAVMYSTLLNPQIFESLHSKPLADVRRIDIARAITAHRDRGYPGAANRALSSVSALYGWLLSRGELESMPVLRGLKTRETPRHRHLLGDQRIGRECELPLLWDAIERLDSGYRGLFQLIALTGQRLREISELKWTEILRDGAMGPRIFLSGDRTKNHKPHVIPLGPEAIQILDGMPKISDYVFPAPRKPGVPLTQAQTAKRILDRTAKQLREARPEIYGQQLVEPWRIHDLRRTFASGVRQLGADWETVDALLNHQSGAANQNLRGTYVITDTWAKQREFAEAWERHVLRITAASPLQQAA